LYDVLTALQSIAKTERSLCLSLFISNTHADAVFGKASFKSFEVDLALCTAVSLEVLECACKKCGRIADASLMLWITACGPSRCGCNCCRQCRAACGRSFVVARGHMVARFVAWPHARWDRTRAAARV
jgi:hypothetical protein